ncbi:MAG: YlxR family protein [Lachnospira sp.]|nr:YlxR family protein [Lachnospira sp.]
MGKKPATRQCVGCCESFDKRNLMRVIKTPEGEIKLDFTGKSNGRGAYLCKKTECLKKAQKNNGLNRSLKVAIPEEIYHQLERELCEIESE